MSYAIKKKRNDEKNEANDNEHIENTSFEDNEIIIEINTMKMTIIIISSATFLEQYRSLLPKTEKEKKKKKCEFFT